MAGSNLQSKPALSPSLRRSRNVWEEQPCCSLKCKMLCEVELAQKKPPPRALTVAVSHIPSTGSVHQVMQVQSEDITFILNWVFQSRFSCELLFAASIGEGGLLCTFTNPRLLTAYQTSWTFTRGVGLKNANREKNGRFPTRNLKLKTPSPTRNLELGTRNSELDSAVFLCKRQLLLCLRRLQVIRRRNHRLPC